MTFHESSWVVHRDPYNLQWFGIITGNISSPTKTLNKIVCLRFLGDQTPTPWKTNMEHNPGGLEDNVPF